MGWQDTGTPKVAHDMLTSLLLLLSFLLLLKGTMSLKILYNNFFTAFFWSFTGFVVFVVCVLLLGSDGGCFSQRN